MTLIVLAVVVGYLILCAALYLSVAGSLRGSKGTGQRLAPMAPAVGASYAVPAPVPAPLARSGSVGYLDDPTSGYSRASASSPTAAAVPALTRTPAAAVPAGPVGVGYMDM